MATAAASGEPASLTTFATPEAFRAAFLTASTWRKATASNLEVAYAMLGWQPDFAVETAIAQMLDRRELDRRGLLRKMARAEREAAKAD